MLPIIWTIILIFLLKNDDNYQDCDEWCGDSDEEDERRHWGDDSWNEDDDDYDDWDEYVYGNYEDEDGDEDEDY